MLSWVDPSKVSLFFTFLALIQVASGTS
uniref:Uncharacterized protein n=1 Tax=Rhizophora mucronata TaxID=61149 RepID=A0A2P2PJ54_RHIMU